MKIAIQVLPYKSQKELPILIQSLQRQSFTDWKLFVHENSCDANELAGVKAQLEASGVPFSLTSGPTNLGFAGGHNELFTQHEAEFVLLLNDDAYLEDGYLEAVLARFAKDVRCAAVTGPVYRWSCPVTERQVLQIDNPIDTLGLLYKSLAEISDLGSGDSASIWKHWLDLPHQLFGVSAAVATYRRSAVLDVSIDQQLFDPFFFMYKEDVDLAIRLARKGYTAWFEPGALSFHRRSVQGAKNIWARLRDERKRPAHLRIAMYRNQWAVYFYHFSAELGLQDVLRVARAELLRAGGTFLISPWVYIEVWLQIFFRGRGWLARRTKFQSKGMPLIRLDTWGK